MVSCYCCDLFDFLWFVCRSDLQQSREDKLKAYLCQPPNISIQPTLPEPKQQMLTLIVSSILLNALLTLLPDYWKSTTGNLNFGLMVSSLLKCRHFFPHQYLFFFPTVSVICALKWINLPDPCLHFDNDKKGMPQASKKWKGRLWKHFTGLPQRTPWLNSLLN